MSPENASLCPKPFCRWDPGHSLTYRDTNKSAVETQSELPEQGPSSSLKDQCPRGCGTKGTRRGAVFPWANNRQLLSATHSLTLETSTSQLDASLTTPELEVIRGRSPTVPPLAQGSASGRDSPWEYINIYDEETKGRGVASPWPHKGHTAGRPSALNLIPKERTPAMTRQHLNPQGCWPGDVKLPLHPSSSPSAHSQCKEIKYSLPLWS